MVKPLKLFGVYSISAHVKLSFFLTGFRNGASEGFASELAQLTQSFKPRNKVFHCNLIARTFSSNI